MLTLHGKNQPWSSFVAEGRHPEYIGRYLFTEYVLMYNKPMISLEQA